MATYTLLPERNIRIDIDAARLTRVKVSSQRFVATGQSAGHHQKQCDWVEAFCSVHVDLKKIADVINITPNFVINSEFSPNLLPNCFEFTPNLLRNYSEFTPNSLRINSNLTPKLTSI